MRIDPDSVIVAVSDARLQRLESLATVGCLAKVQAADENDLGIFARQLRQLGVNIPWVGSPSVVAVSSTKLAGPALFGTYGVASSSRVHCS